MAKRFIEPRRDSETVDTSRIKKITIADVIESVNREAWERVQEDETNV